MKRMKLFYVLLTVVLSCGSSYGKIRSIALPVDAKGEWVELRAIEVRGGARDDGCCRDSRFSHAGYC